MTPDGRPVAVAPGVHRLALPLPGPPGEVNAWLVEDGPGWLVVDTGLATPGLQGIWDAVFAHGLGGRPVTRVLVTHFHPDHVGLAGWICANWQVPLLMPRSEWLKARLLLADSEAEVLEDLVAFHRRAGSPEAHLDHLRRRGPIYRGRVAPLPRQVQAIGDGERLSIGGRDWQVMVGPGHAPEMACLWNAADGVLIAADHILPRISPHVGVMPAEPEADPLGLYLASLRDFARLPSGTLVLPSHGEPFRGLQARIEALLRHHDERLDRLRAAFTGSTGLTVHQAIPFLFARPLGPDQLGAAASETLAHLVRLVRRGEFAASTEHGVLRFAPVAGGSQVIGPHG